MREMKNENKTQGKETNGCFLPQQMPRSVDRNEGVAGWKVGGCDDANDVERKKEGRKCVGKGIWRREKEWKGGESSRAGRLGRYLH